MFVGVVGCVVGCVWVDGGCDFYGIGVFDLGFGCNLY